MPFFRMRSVAEELEAHFADGKAERKRYTNGEERLKVVVRGLAFADGTRAEVLIGGRLAAASAVDRGRLRIEIERDVPAARAGETIEVRIGGQVIASGVFVAE